MKNEKLIIVGKSGSGKDFLQRELIKKGLNFEPKVTTRPIRSGELEGREYKFMTNQDFSEIVKQDQVFTKQSFQIENEIWHYAITKSNFEKNNVFIMTPHEIAQLDSETRKICFIVYLDIDEEIRRKRVIRRKDMNDSVNRRFKADSEDFESFVDYDMKITDAEFEVEVIYDLMF